MSLLPDPATLLAIADRIAGHAAAARARANALGAAVAGAEWRGPAADAFAWTAYGVLSGLHRAGRRLDDAADALRRHARVVSALVQELERLAGHTLGLGADIGRTVEDALVSPGSLVGDGRELLGDSAGLVVDVGDLLGLG
ncbi:MAG TPA: hypothetical protein VHS54_11065 [Jatrophihabitans sp.]|jgi:hypothetical protein|nr:hypothetical protein [Jatrophihabitans sp.]